LNLIILEKSLATRLPVDDLPLAPTRLKLSVL